MREEDRRGRGGWHKSRQDPKGPSSCRMSAGPTGNIGGRGKKERSKKRSGSFTNLLGFLTRQEKRGAIGGGRTKKGLGGLSNRKGQNQGGGKKKEKKSNTTNSWTKVDPCNFGQRVRKRNPASEAILLRRLNMKGENHIMENTKRRPPIGTKLYQGAKLQKKSSTSSEKGPLRWKDGWCQRKEGGEKPGGDSRKRGKRTSGGKSWEILSKAKERNQRSL